MRRQLGQLRPADTAAAALVTSADSKSYNVEYINVCNVHATLSTDVSIFHDEDGATFSEETALLWEYTLSIGEVLHFEAPVSGYKQTSTVGVQSSVASAATFTAYGEIFGEQL
jgi:hypothetical protein